MGAKFCKCSEPSIEGTKCRKCKQEIQPERLKLWLTPMDQWESESPKNERERLAKVGPEIEAMVPRSEEIVLFSGCQIKGRQNGDASFSGYVVITKESIFLLKQKFKLMGKPEPFTKEVMRLNQISGVDQSFEKYLGSKTHHVRLTRANNEDVLFGLSADVASKIVDTINEQMSNPSTVVNSDSDDSIEKLMQLASLLDKGLITKEEFDKKKAQLL